MVEVTVKLNMEGPLVETRGPNIVFALQVLATLVGVFYLVYEAAYPSFVRRRAAVERKEEFNKRYRFSQLNTGHLVEDEDRETVQLGAKFRNLGALQAGMTRAGLLDAVREHGEAAGLNMDVTQSMRKRSDH